MRYALLALALVALFPSFAQERVQTRVNITSQPSGATVFVDGQNRGQTPLMLFDLQPGRHHVKYRLAGYVEADDTFGMSEGPIIDRDCILREEKGLLLLKTEPEGCQIKIDGLSLGTTPRFIGTLSTREPHTVRLSKPGYQDQTISVKFNGRVPLVREERLVLDSGVVNITTEPEGAEVTLNGIVRGRTPLLVKDIPKGTATVKIRLDGFREEVRELRLSAGEQQTLSLALTGIPGSLHLLSKPARAFFYVNDEPRGRAPVSITGLKPGRYVVRCEAEGYAPMTKTIEIGNAKAVREEFTLSNMRGRIELRTTPAGAEVILDGRKVGETKGSGGPSDPSDVFAIENVMAGEHSLVVRREGFQAVSRTVKVEEQATAKLNRLLLKSVFCPNIEIVTATGTFRGVFKSQTDSTIIIETKPGTDYPIPRQFVRDVKYLTDK